MLVGGRMGPRGLGVRARLRLSAGLGGMLTGLLRRLLARA
jgi:hypothetical protein